MLDGCAARLPALSRLPSVDVAAAGDAVVAWHTGTLSRHGNSLTRELLAAQKPAGGIWSPPEAITSHRVDPVLGPPALLFNVGVVLEPASGRVTASWTEEIPGPGDEGWRLLAATRAPGGPWQAPVTVDPPVAVGVDVGERVVVGVAVAVESPWVVWAGHDWVGREDAPELRVVVAAVHVDVTGAVHAAMPGVADGLVSPRWRFGAEGA